MRHLTTVLFAIIYPMLSGCVAANEKSMTDYELSDEAVIALQNSAVDLERVWFIEPGDTSKHKRLLDGEFIGLHNGLPLRAQYRCGDLCPDYTSRILYYDVPLTECESRGGVIGERAIPMGIAVGREKFCLPSILLEKR